MNVVKKLKNNLTVKIDAKYNFPCCWLLRTVLKKENPLLKDDVRFVDAYGQTVKFPEYMDAKNFDYPTNVNFTI